MVHTYYLFLTPPATVSGVIINDVPYVPFHVLLGKYALLRTELMVSADVAIEMDFQAALKKCISSLRLSSKQVSRPQHKFLARYYARFFELYLSAQLIVFLGFSVKSTY